jgi:hypothetical protein
MAEPYFQGRESSLQQGIGSLYRRLPTNMRLLIENLLSVDSPITEKDFKPEELEYIREQIAYSKRIYEAQEANLRAMYERLNSPDYEHPEVYSNQYPLKRGNITVFGSSEPGKLEDVSTEHLEAKRQQDLDNLKRDIETYERTVGRTAVTNPYGWKDRLSPSSREDSEVNVDQPWGESLRKSFTDPRYNVATSLGQYVAEDVEGGMRVTDEYNFNPQERNLPGGLAALWGMLSSPELLGEYLANAFGTSPRNVDINLPDI